MLGPTLRFSAVPGIYVKFVSIAFNNTALIFPMA